MAADSDRGNAEEILHQADEAYRRLRDDPDASKSYDREVKEMEGTLADGLGED